MALAYSKIRQGVDDRNRFVECDVTFDNSYPTGGEPVDLAALGLKEVRRAFIVFEVYPDGNSTSFTTHGRQVVPVLTSPTAPKLLVYTANNTEAGNTSDQSQIVSRVRFLGS